MVVAGNTLPGVEELARFPVQGGSTLLAQGNEVYWTTYSVPGAPLLGGGPTTVEVFGLTIGETSPRRLWRQERPGNRSQFGRLWASGPDLVWVDFFPSKPPTSGTVYALARAGGEARILVDRIDTTGLTGGLSSLGADDESLYIAPISPVGISALSRATGQTTRHIARPSPPKLAAFEGDYLYWVEGDSLWRARRDGSDPQLLASGVSAPAAMAVHGGIAWLVPGRGATQRLMRVSIQGNVATCTAASWPEPGQSADVVAPARAASTSPSTNLPVSLAIPSGGWETTGARPGAC